MKNDVVLEVKNLQVNLISVRGLVHAVRDINLTIHQGEIHGIVGESGCGKTMTARSVLRLHDESKTFYGGEILYHVDQSEEKIFDLKMKDVRKIRGKEISMVFQDPITTLNPLITVGEQISETMRTHLKLGKKEAEHKAVEILESVGIRPGPVRYKQYPFEFSGGMLQRAIIAMAICCNPRLLIADEPTTALDVTMQAQILDLLLKLREEYNTSMMIITHNFGVIAEICDTVSVMYAGKIVETGSVEEIFHQPMHPYTQDLIASIPKSGSSNMKLVTIPGTPPPLNQTITGCAYAPRCRYATKQCVQSDPMIRQESTTHAFACCVNLQEGR